MDNNSDQKPTVPTRLPPSPPQRPQQPPPRDAVAKQGSPLSLRPVWQAIPRLASYGMVGFIIWIILSVMFPYVFVRSSERAIVNSPVSLITTPVEGVVTKQLVPVGTTFTAGQSLMTLQNPNMDRALLMELTGKKLDNDKRLEAARSKLEVNQARLAATNGDVKRYVSVAQQQNDARIRGIEARLAAAQQQMEAQVNVVTRNEAMQQAGAVSQAFTEASRNQLAVLGGQKDAIEAELNGARSASAATRNRVYASNTDGAAGALSQRSDELKAENAQLQAEIKQLQEYGAEVDKLVNTEQQRLDRVSNLDIKAYAGGVVEDVLAPPGTHVAAGATLMRATNCTTPSVVAVFPRSLSKDLLPGAPVTVMVDGVATPLSGKVAEILPRAPDGDQARYFVPFPPIEKNELYLIAKLNKPLPDLPGAGKTDRCALGHWAKVSLDRPWFRRLI